MVTPELEKLILEGKATYKTFVAGGSTKSILDLQINRWIVITDFVVYPFLPSSYPISLETFGAEFQNGIITQMNIFSNKSYNSFVFRNSINWVVIGDNVYPSLVSPIKYDTYLIGEQSIVFNFLRAENNVGNLLTTTDVGLTPADSIGLKPPLDYGKSGLPTSINVPRVRNTGILAGEFRPLGNKIPNLSNPSFTELSFPVNASTDFSGESAGALQFPIVNVGYVEIFGSKVMDLQPS